MLVGTHNQNYINFETKRRQDNKMKAGLPELE